MKKPLHNSSCTSLNHAMWSPDEDITTVCQDNYLRTYDAPRIFVKSSKVVSEQAKYKVRHDNRTADG